MGTIGLGIRGRAGRRLLRWGVVTYALGGFIFDVLVAEVLIFGLVDVVVLGHFEVYFGLEQERASDRFDGCGIGDQLWEERASYRKQVLRLIIMSILRIVSIRHPGHLGMTQRGAACGQII